MELSNIEKTHQLDVSDYHQLAILFIDALLIISDLNLPKTAWKLHTWIENNQNVIESFFNYARERGRRKNNRIKERHIISRKAITVCRRKQLA